MDSKNSRMHFNPLYDQKTGQKIEKRVGKHFLIAQINARMLLNLKMINLIQFDHVMVRSENHLKWVFVTLGKCSSRNRS